MHASTMNTLQEIGAQLDQNRFPRVYNGGVVVPNEAAVFPSTLGKETSNVERRKRRPATGSRQGTTGWQGQTYRPGPAHKASPVICASLRKQYEVELDAVRETYPGTKFWHQAEGLWLLTESAILSDLGKKATFLAAIPYSPKLAARSWGFWTSPVFNQWIGPRHTNFPDGSICAFEPRDKTWVGGDSIVKLLDFYTLWALRHLHLETFGRWPGYQSVPYPYERRTELHDDEFCGCSCSPPRLYGECCKQRDLVRDQIADKFDFLIKFAKGGLRTPPEAILKLIWRRDEPPAFFDLPA